jgi:hypothetical protein
MVRQGDTTFQDEAAILPGSFVGGFTRDSVAATGVVAITGVGFRPNSLHTFGEEAVNDVFSHGLFDGTNQNCVYEVGSGVYAHNSTSAFHYEPSSGNHQDGIVTSFDADGFTISWTKTGSPTGNARIKFMAFK